jgi:hypothetical protein
MRPTFEFGPANIEERSERREPVGLRKSITAGLDTDA